MKCPGLAADDLSDFLGFSLLGIGMRPELRMARYLEALKGMGCDRYQSGEAGDHAA
jgi:hypothetical protein